VLAGGPGLFGPADLPTKPHSPHLNPKLARFKLRIRRSRIGRLDSLPPNKIELFNVL
jgi:hypothetical protein